MSVVVFNPCCCLACAQVGVVVPQAGATELQLFPPVGVTSVSQTHAKAAKARVAAYGPVMQQSAFEHKGARMTRRTHVPSQTHLQDVRVVQANDVLMSMMTLVLSLLMACRMW